MTVTNDTQKAQLIDTPKTSQIESANSCTNPPPKAPKKKVVKTEGVEEMQELQKAKRNLSKELEKAMKEISSLKKKNETLQKKNESLTEFRNMHTRPRKLKKSVSTDATMV
jgi:predicted RNase H-like nuclease (RuvC/YqgF family)